MVAAARSRHAAQLAFDAFMGRTMHYPLKRKDYLDSLGTRRVMPADVDLHGDWKILANGSRERANLGRCGPASRRVPGDRAHLFPDAAITASSSARPSPPRSGDPIEDFALRVGLDPDFLELDHTDGDSPDGEDPIEDLGQGAGA